MSRNPPPPQPTTPDRPGVDARLVLTELFALSNLGFLGVDIALAHAVNQFENPSEWIPLYFSAGGSCALLLAQVVGRYRVGPATGPEPGSARLARTLGLAVGWLAIVLGVLGLVFHLKSQFFSMRTLKSLVYSAPFIAPLAYTGIGLLVLLNRMVSARSREWGWWVITLTAFGFAGNFVLCLADHAQNGFFRSSEWIGVVAAAYTTAALIAVMIWPQSGGILRFAVGTLAVSGVVGMLGAALHLMGNLQTESLPELYRMIRSGELRQMLGSPRLHDAFIYGAPAFAPLLFTNLAILGGLGLWGLARAHDDRSAADLEAERPRQIVADGTWLSPRV